MNVEDFSPKMETAFESMIFPVKHHGVSRKPNLAGGRCAGGVLVRTAQETGQGPLRGDVSMGYPNPMAGVYFMEDPNINRKGRGGKHVQKSHRKLQT